MDSKIIHEYKCAINDLDWRIGEIDNRNRIIVQDTGYRLLNDPRDDLLPYINSLQEAKHSFELKKDLVKRIKCIEDELKKLEGY